MTAENPYPPGDPTRLTRLETRVDTIDQRVSLTEANWARLDERSARIAEDVGRIRHDVHEGLSEINDTVAKRSASVNRLAWFLGTLLVGTLAAVIADLGARI